MLWYHYVALFFGGAFLANAIPHLVAGVMGEPFQSPFAKPPGVGLSSSRVNVLWGFLNLVFSYLLLCQVGDFSLHSVEHVGVAGFGGLLLSLHAGHHFGQFHGGRNPPA